MDTNNNDSAPVVRWAAVGMRVVAVEDIDPAPVEETCEQIKAEAWAEGYAAGLAARKD